MTTPYAAPGEMPGQELPTTSLSGGVSIAARSAAAVLVVAIASMAATAVHGPYGYSSWNVALGVSAGIVLLGGGWMLPAVIAGKLLAAWAEGWATPMGAGAVNAFACGIVGVVAGLALRRFVRRDPAEWAVRDAVAVVSAAMVAGVLMMAYVWLRRTASDLPPLPTAGYFRVWVGSASGLVLGLPAIASAVALAREGVARRLHGVQLADVVLHALFTLGVGAAAYLLRGPTGERFWSLYFLPLLWTAFTFGTPGVVASLVLVSVEAIVIALLVRTPPDTLTNYHFFLFNFTATALLLAAALGARRTAERARGRSEALLAGALRIMDDALVLIRLGDGTIVDMNDAWLRLTGRAREELDGESLFALSAWEGDAGSQLRARVRRHEVVTDLQAAIRQPSGATRAVEVDIEYVRFDAEEFGVAFVRDVTDRRLLERQRLQAQKLEAVGLLAGGVAHDFNNILTVISSAGEMLREELVHGDPRRQDAESILDASRRGAQLTRQLLAFSRQRDDAPPREWAVADVIGEMLGMLRRLLGHDVTIETRLDADARVMAAPGQLEQVILNLAINARDAMERQGTLVISARAVQLYSETFVAKLGARVAAGQWTEISVRDTGSGIDPAVVGRIFEPFFTTKPEGKGTGLGLSTVYGIVKSVGGHVGVKSEIGVGTEFVVWWKGGAGAGGGSGRP